MPTDNDNAEFVMPAWIAGIQIRKDAFGNFRVSLDSSTPCWNDAIEGAPRAVSYVWNLGSIGWNQTVRLTVYDSNPKIRPRLTGS